MMIQVLNYKVLEKLYESPHSLLYRACHIQTNQSVVLKVLREEYPKPAQVAMLRREYEILSSFQHPTILKTYSLEPYQRTWVLILENFAGRSLDHLFSENPASIAEFLKIAIQMAQVLQVIHRGHVIHKDVTPANFLWKASTEELRIIDFGLSSPLKRELPKIVPAKQLEGTLAYIAPEQTGRMNRQIDFRSDLYSLGATFYFMPTGTPPFAGAGLLEMVHNHIAKSPIIPHPSFPNIPQTIWDIVAKTLNKDAENRYQTAEALQQDLERCLASWQTQGVIVPFPLAKAAESGNFQIPSKLYGRDKEIQALHQSFENAQSGKSEIVLIEGYSGIGKTAVVHELNKTIFTRHGHFIEGKFEEYHRHLPYHALIQAFQSIIQQILTEDHEKITAWKEKILKALGSQANLMIEIIPELELILGPQPALSELPPAEAQHRFRLCFQRFVSAFAVKSYPLFIFLDDLQWADLSSLKLLEEVIAMENQLYLMLIVSWRNNEVDAAHPFTQTLQKIEKSDFLICRIILSPLQETGICQMLADTLHMPPQETLDLAQFIQKKTGGNPFFIRQLLNRLYEDEQIVFDPKSKSWTWTSVDALNGDFAENVLDFMIERVQKLPPETRDLLLWAACVHDSFDLQFLATLVHKNMYETFQALWPAIDQELIFPLDDSWKQFTAKHFDHSPNSAFFRFTHDRIRQAVDSLMDSSQRASYHLRIGKWLQEQSTPENEENQIFEKVSHFNQALDLLQTPVEKEEVFLLNWRAGKKAKQTQAYATAFHCLRTAQSLLSKETWQNDYATMITLFQDAAEAAFYAGDLEIFNELVQEALQQARNRFDKIPFHCLQSDVCVMENRSRDAIQLLLPVLAELGIHFPANPGFNDIAQKMSAIGHKLSGKSLEDLRTSPLLTDPHILDSMKIIVSAIASAYRACPPLFPLLCLELLELTIDHGNSPYAPSGYSLYSLLLCSGGDIETGYQYALLSERLVEELNAEVLKPRILHVNHVFVRYHKEPLKDMQEALLKASALAREMGDIEFITLPLHAHSYHAFFMGHNLSELQQAMLGHMKMMRKLGQMIPLRYIELCYQTVFNLMENPAEPWQFSGPVFNESEHLNLLENSSDLYGMLMFHFMRGLLAYHVGNFAEAQKHIQLAEPYLEGNTSLFAVSSLYFYYRALIALALYEETPPTGQPQILRDLEAWEAKVSFSAECAPMNNRHRLFLIQAEKARVLSDFTQAKHAYDQAIEWAGKNEFPNDEALCLELAGRFYVQHGQHRVAKIYLAEALYLYESWDANTLVARLYREYEPLLQLIKRRPATLTSTSLSRSGSVSEIRRSAALDIDSLLKSSQAISGEVDLEQLLPKMLHIMMENTGAQRGIFLLKQNVWLIQATAGVEQELVETMQEIPFDSEQAVMLLPRSVALYVIRTGEPLALDHTIHDKRFHRDHYVVTHSLKSVFCHPVFHQGKLISLLYLENNLTPGAFPMERLGILQALGAQLAISIDNALLYSNLNQLSSERTQVVTTQPQQTESTLEHAELQFSKDLFLKSLVSTMTQSLDCWEVATQKDVIALAEESGLWAVNIDDGRLRARSMERYLELSRLPKNPRWRNVIRTASFVLSRCSLPLEARQQLEHTLNTLLLLARQRSLSSSDLSH